MIEHGSLFKLWFDCVFRLTPPEQRSMSAFFRFFLPHLSVENDIAYITYLLFRLVSILGIIVLAFIYLDIQFRMDWLIKPEAFMSKKLILSSLFAHTMTWPVLFLSALFYLRIRLFYDVEKNSLNLNGGNKKYKTYLQNLSRRKWIFQSLLIILLCVVGVPLSDIFVTGLAVHYGVQNSMIFISLLLVIQWAAISSCSFLLVSSLLTLEKSVRFFSEFQRDLITPEIKQGNNAH